MLDKRSDATRTVYKLLKRASFRECLMAKGDDNGHPLVIALPDDPMSSVLSHVKNAGGVANVVVPRDTYVMVLAVTKDGRGSVRVPASGTIGTFIDGLIASPESGGTNPRRGTRAAGRPVRVPVCA